MSTLVYSASSALGYAAGISDTCWLKDPLDPTNNFEVGVEGSDEFTFTAELSSTFFDVVGRKHKVGTIDVVKGDEFSFTIYLFSDVDEPSFDLMFNNARTVLLQLPDGRQWYIVMQKRTKRLQPGTGTFLYVDIDCIEVDQPI